MTQSILEKKQILLEQRKNRLLIEETKLKEKQRRLRTRNLIEYGGLIAKAKLDHLSKTTLFGALLTLKTKLEQTNASNHNNTNTDTIISNWATLGKEYLEKEQQQTTPVILSFIEKPPLNIRQEIRKLNLKFNSFRNEWYGNILDLNSLKSLLQNNNLQPDVNYSIELVS